MGDLYECNQTFNFNYLSLRNNAKICFIVYRLGVLVFMITAIAFICLPFVVNIIEGGELQPMLPCMLPFIDYKTNFGFIATMAFHCFIIFLALAGTIGTDLTVMIILLHGISLSNIFNNAFIDINKFTTCNHIDGRQQFLIKFKLRNIVQMHIETCK